jgi:hypothetical protein
MFRVEQEIKTEVETSFAETKQGQQAMQTIKMFKAIDGTLHIYAIGKHGSVLKAGFVIDKEAGEEFLEKIAKAVKTEELQAVLDSYEPTYCKHCLVLMGLDVNNRLLCGNCGSREVRSEESKARG